MPQRRKYFCLAHVLLVIAIFPIHTAAQDKNIWNEYRPSLVFAMPINEKWIAWQYTLGVYAPEKKLTTYGLAAGHCLQAEGQAGLCRLDRVVGRDALRMDRQLPKDEQLGDSSRGGRQDVHAEQKEAEHLQLCQVRVPAFSPGQENDIPAALSRPHRYRDSAGKG